MKIEETNSGTLETHSSGFGTLFTSIIFVIAGIAIAIFILLSSSVEQKLFALAGLVFVVIGGFIAYGATKRDVVLRGDGESVVTETKILTKKVTEYRFSPEEVDHVTLDTSIKHTRSSDGDTERKRVSTLFVTLKDTTEVVILGGQTGGFSVDGFNLSAFGKAPLSEEAEKVATLYGVELTHSGNSLNTMKEAIHTVQEEIADASKEHAEKRNDGSF